MTIAMNRLYRTALAAALTLTTASLRAANGTVCESPEASEPLSSRTIRHYRLNGLQHKETVRLSRNE